MKNLAKLTTELIYRFIRELLSNQIKAQISENVKKENGYFFLIAIRATRDWQHPSVAPSWILKYRVGILWG